VDPAPERLRVALAAPTGKAAARLRQSIERRWQGLQASACGGRAGLGALRAHGRGAHPARAAGRAPDTRRFATTPATR
jgi:exodeoxyribonuclease V alpha subunit